MSKTLTISLMAAVAALAAGCGTTAPQSTAPARSPGTTSSPSPSPRSGQVGDKFTVSSGDMKYDVRLLSVEQQAQPQTEFERPEPGHHLAAAQFRITAITKTDENSNNSATVTGSDEQAYTSALAEITAGTNFASGEIRLQPGSSLVGWVAFELPAGVRVAKVQWTPASGFGTQGAEWLVGSSAPASPAPTATAAPSPTATPGQATSPEEQATSPEEQATSPEEQATSPEETVNGYFDAINRRDFHKAWNLGGKNSGASSFASFVAGFKTTSMVSVQILDLSGDIGTAVVTARLTTLETDGSSKVFEGEYTVRHGVIVRFSVRQVS